MPGQEQETVRILQTDLNGKCNAQDHIPAGIFLLSHDMVKIGALDSGNLNQLFCRYSLLFHNGSQLIWKSRLRMVPVIFSCLFKGF